MSFKDQAIQAIQETLQKAKDRYTFDQHVNVIFRNTGKTAGRAQRNYTGYYIILNTQLLTADKIQFLCDDTIPHEIAHLVCYNNPMLGRNHDRGWQQVCINLGGNGQRCHKMAVQKARRTRKAIYNINGRELQVGLTQHKRIQTHAQSYHLNKCKTEILPDHFTGKIIKS